MAAVFQRLTQRVLQRLERCLVDQGADQGVRLQRVADAQAAVGRQQPVQQRLLDIAVHDQAAQRGAALAGRAHGAEDNGTHGQIQIGSGRDHHGVVSAQLQNAFAKARRHLGAHSAAHTARPRGRYQCNPGTVHQGLGDSCAAQHDLRQTCRSAVPKPRNGPLQCLEGGQAR